MTDIETEDEGEFLAKKHGTGKWGRPDVPKKNWVCIAAHDQGEPTHVCEMCESKLCRYVHSMQHSQYGDILECGRICAGHMECDFQAADKRDAKLKNATAKAKRDAKRDAKREAERRDRKAASATYNGPEYSAVREQARQQRIATLNAQPAWITTMNGNPMAKLRGWRTIVFRFARGRNTGKYGYIIVEGDHPDGDFSRESFLNLEQAKAKAWQAIQEAAIR